MILGVPKEIAEGENRVAISPETASKLVKLGFKVIVEKSAGASAYFTDEEFAAAGCDLLNSSEEIFSNSDIILKVAKPQHNQKTGKHELESLKKGGTVISFLYPLNYKEILDVAVKEGASLISMDFVPRTTLAQKMDALSSQANIAGFKSVLVGAVELPKIFPLMMTAAGTVKPAKVVIMGAGVAGLQALGTAKRLGAIVEVSDIRPAVKQEVESLGGRFIEVEMDPSMQDERGYAKEATPEFLQKQKELIFKHVTNADLVITTALVPGRKAPILVSAEMIKNMRPGSVVVDIATEFGGNCELSEHNKTVISNGVKIISAPNLASEVSTLSSELYGKNLLALISHLSKEGVMNIDSEDEILKGCLIVKKGEIVNNRVKEFYGL